MSAIANIAVYDGAASPALHTLLPLSIKRDGNGVLAEWREVSSLIPTIAQVRASLRLEKSKQGVNRVEARVVVPVQESISNQNAAGYTAAPKIAYDNTLYCVGMFHERSTLTDRRLARMILVNMLNDIQTSVAAQVGGPGPEAYDLLVMPT